MFYQYYNYSLFIIIFIVSKLQKTNYKLYIDFNITRKYLYVYQSFSINVGDIRNSLFKVLYSISQK